MGAFTKLILKFRLHQHFFFRRLLAPKPPKEVQFIQDSAPLSNHRIYQIIFFYMDRPGVQVSNLRRSMLRAIKLTLNHDVTAPVLSCCKFRQKNSDSYRFPTSNIRASFFLVLVLKSLNFRDDPWLTSNSYGFY